MSANSHALSRQPGEDFIFQLPTPRALFGRGKILALAEEARRLGERVMIVSGKGGPGGKKAAEILGDAVVGVFDGATMHVPKEIAEKAGALARHCKADCCVAVGGGSAVGAGKAVALAEDIPLLAVPTTFAGSEMTPIWGMTTDGVKSTGRSEKVRPKTVIYDADFLDELPASIAGPSGINAAAHCAEALYAEDANPIVSLLAEEGIRALSAGLRGMFGNGDRRAAAENAFYGAWLAGMSLGAVGMALHHKLCHALGGGFNLPHAETHAIILPHAVAYNRAAAKNATMRMASALGAKDAAAGFYALARDVGAPAGLKDIGMKESDLPKAAELATRNPYYNPASLKKDLLEQLLRDAFDGAQPRS